jgi:hypothetical protein
MNSNQNETVHMTRAEIMRQKRLEALTKEPDTDEEQVEEPVVEEPKKRVKRVIRATPAKEAAAEPATPGAPRKRTRARKNSKGDDISSVDTATSVVTQDAVVAPEPEPEPVANLDAQFEKAAETVYERPSDNEIAEMWNEPETEAESDKSVETADSKAPKKRGRKPKLDADGQPVKTKKQLAMEAARDHAMSLPYDATTPKKRGRKPKAKVEGEESTEKKETKKRPRKSNAEKQAIENKKATNKMVNVFIKDMAALMIRVRNLKKPASEEAANGPKEYVDMLNEIVQRCTQDVKEINHSMFVSNEESV